MTGKPCINSRPILLLAEDSPDDAFFFKRALEHSRLECEFAHVYDGVAAVQVLREAHSNPSKIPDLIFLDLKMPLMSGFEVLEWIQQQSFAGSIRVIVLSGSDQETDRTRARDLGASDYLVKPITVRNLSDQLRFIAEGANS